MYYVFASEHSSLVSKAELGSRGETTERSMMSDQHAQCVKIRQAASSLISAAAQSAPRSAFKADTVYSTSGNIGHESTKAAVQGSYLSVFCRTLAGNGVPLGLGCFSILVLVSARTTT